jgi:hypothetical protein
LVLWSGVKSLPMAFVGSYVEDDCPSVNCSAYGSSKAENFRLIGRLHAWFWKLTGGRLGNAFGKAPIR